MEQSIHRIIDGKVFRLTGTCNPKDGCQAYCCKVSQMKVKNIMQDEREYFLLHRCQILEKGDTAHVLMPTPCTKLGADLLCTSYDSRPMICRKYARTPGELFYSPACTLFWKEVTGREAQVAMMKAKKGDPTILA